MRIPIEVFISHAQADKTIAREIGNALEQVDGITVFVAHDDLDTGGNWKLDLVRKIGQCDAFIVLITENFHGAEWTEQEVGIAQAFRKPMYPIRFDDTKIYGYAGEYQGQKIHKPIDEVEIKILADLIFSLSEQGQKITNGNIESLGSADNFYDANDRAVVLFSSTSKFTDAQINKLAYYFVNNRQVYEAWRAEKLCLELFQKNRNKIQKELRDEVDKFLQHSS